MRRLLTLLVSYCIIMPSPAFSWWETGHQVIARVAAAHLTPAARSRIARIIGVEDSPEILADALAGASTWADETKAETKTGSWHFIDLAIQDRKSDISLRCPDNNCVSAQVAIFTAQLSSKSPVTSRWSDLDALRYVVHFVGDIHQPLHTISDADLGGNCERVDPPVDKAKNLHALWDGALVDAVNPNDRALASELEKDIDAMPAKVRAAITAGNEDDWIWESHELALQDVYVALHIPTEPVEFPASCLLAPPAITSITLEIGNTYMDEMKPVVRHQLAIAGLRLARVLNEAL